METLATNFSSTKQGTKLERVLRLLLGVAMLLAALIQPVQAYAATKETPITSVGFPTAITLKVGETRTLSVTVNPSRTTYRTNIQWGAQNNGCFTNKANGFGSYWGSTPSETITGKKPGKGYLTTTVKVYDSTGCYVRSYTIRTTVTVVAATPSSVALQKITLNRSSLSVNVDSTARLSVSYVPTNTTVNRTVTWTSSNNSIATVKNGVITGKKAGTVTITARVGNRTATCRVTVTNPLRSISINKTSLTLTAGQTGRLTVSFNPSNAASSSNVTWTSSNTAIATVSNGVVTAKKAGTVTITAKVGDKSVTCRVTVKPKSTPSTTSTSKPASTTNTTTKSTSVKGTYRNVSSAYTYLNTFRTTRANQWYWNADNRTRTYTYGLQNLRRDADLERTAQVRAQEAWTQYYVYGRATHTRPNGSDCFTAFPASVRMKGENILWGMTDPYAVIMDGWAETTQYYNGQGHRRNMLDSRFTRVGIACYEQDGKVCWVMCLGS